MLLCHNECVLVRRNAESKPVRTHGVEMGDLVQAIASEPLIVGGHQSADRDDVGLEVLLILDFVSVHALGLFHEASPSRRGPRRFAARQPAVEVRGAVALGEVPDVEAFHFANLMRRTQGLAIGRQDAAASGLACCFEGRDDECCRRLTIAASQGILELSGTTCSQQQAEQPLARNEVHVQQENQVRTSILQGDVPEGVDGVQAVIHFATHLCIGELVHGRDCPQRHGSAL
mmetsp:Transcript_149948/g.481839  ORF Transcript_149948/g.481839 Transcript_149948/m.481839 type:complete len:231 (+) Transcript_149948:780-1472(+)